MTDDIKPLESRITQIISNEQRLNRNRQTALKANDDRRNVEKRKEDGDLATLETEKRRQVRANTIREGDFLQSQEREGREIIGLSKEIQRDYIAELEHRKFASNSLQQKVTTLETKLRNIEAGRK